MEIQEGKSFQILPPSPEKCQVCAVEHDPQDPHDQQSLYYQVTFIQANGRSPTWADAMAHCSDEVRQQWTSALKEHGIAVEGEGGEQNQNEQN